MLVIANGAIKSGSTWLFQILSHMTDFPPPPKEYLNPTWANPSIDPDKLADFLEMVDFSTANYLCKNHLEDKAQRDLLLSYPNVFILDIERDIRDVVVSAYYHFCREGYYSGSFESFYWMRGRNIANDVINYHKTWNVNPDRVFVSCYENLKRDFGNEVERIGKFLKLKVTEQIIDKCKSNTEFTKLKSREKSKNNLTFFRKGIVGDWQNHFNDGMLVDLEKIQSFGLSGAEPLKVKAIKLFYKAKRKIERLFYLIGSKSVLAIKSKV